MFNYSENSLYCEDVALADIAAKAKRPAAVAIESVEFVNGPLDAVRRENAAGT
jgi:hypothetical protein